MLNLQAARIVNLLYRLQRKHFKEQQMSFTKWLCFHGIDTLALLYLRWVVVSMIIFIVKSPETVSNEETDMKENLSLSFLSC